MITTKWMQTLAKWINWELTTQFPAEPARGTGLATLVGWSSPAIFTITLGSSSITPKTKAIHTTIEVWDWGVSLPTSCHTTFTCDALLYQMGFTWYLLMLASSLILQDVQGWILWVKSWVLWPFCLRRGIGILSEIPNCLSWDLPIVDWVIVISALPQIQETMPWPNGVVAGKIPHAHSPRAIHIKGVSTIPHFFFY